jgi:uncharacterized protein (UPF0548 family)
VRLGPARLGRAPLGELDRALARARTAAVTYDHVGSTLDARRFPGRAPRSFGVELPGAGAAFDAAAAGLRAWVPQRGLGARIHPPGAALEPGTTLLVVAAFGPAELVAPNRVVEVVDEPGRFGYAYGTLPGHPERGEECFLVERVARGALRLTVRVDAVPGTALTRALGPLVPRAQAAAIRRYLRALAAHARERGS